MEPKKRTTLGYESLRPPESGSRRRVTQVGKPPVGGAAGAGGALELLRAVHGARSVALVDAGEPLDVAGVGAAVPREIARTVLPDAGELCALRTSAGAIVVARLSGSSQHAWVHFEPDVAMAAALAAVTGLGLACPPAPARQVSGSSPLWERGALPARGRAELRALFGGERDVLACVVLDADDALVAGAGREEVGPEACEGIARCATAVAPVRTLLRALSDSGVHASGALVTQGNVACHGGASPDSTARWVIARRGSSDLAGWAALAALGRAARSR